MTKKNTPEESQTQDKGSVSMIAPHPYKKKPEEMMRPVEDLAKDAKIKNWELAGLMKAANWAPGKQVDQNTFDTMLDKFRKRPQGSGKI